MSRPTLTLVSRLSNDDRTILFCPGPGHVRWLRTVGEGLLPASTCGVLRRDGRAFDLLVPEGVQGFIETIEVSGTWALCEHGTPLAILANRSAEAALSAASGSGESSATEGHLVRSPSHGTFYRRASPDAPAYVEAGQHVDAGATIGLVEVMKCFSPIAFEPPAGFTRGRVLEVLVADGAEVQAQQPLLRVEF